MRIYIVLINIIFACTFLTCVANNQLQTVVSNEERIGSERNNCIAPELLECINTYITEVHGDRVGFVHYYNVFFFEKQKKSFFTIWISLSAPHPFINNNNASLYNLSHLKIRGRDIILIAESKKAITTLYNCKNITFEELLTKVEQDDKVTQYDGSHFPKTYEVLQKEEKPHFKALDTALIEFLGKDFVDFENNIRKKP